MHEVRSYVWRQGLVLIIRIKRHIGLKNHLAGSVKAGVKMTMNIVLNKLCPFQALIYLL